MTGQDIETILKKKLHTYIPVIASDEIPTLCKYINKNTNEFGFIINSDPHNMPGHHWLIYAFTTVLRVSRLTSAYAVSRC